ncbi:hypothetical protein LINPERPRIM_LOCUS9793 [Linum perenne]
MTTIDTDADRPRKTADGGVPSTAAAATSKVEQSKIGSFKRWGRRYPFVRYGLPMISLTVIGALGLGHLLQGSFQCIQTYVLDAFSRI